MERKNRLIRILEMINLLSSSYKKWRARELADHFGVSATTIYRDFEVMDEMRIPIYNDPTNHTYGILEDFYFKQPDITRDEALALLLAGQAFQREFFPYKESLNTAIAKIINSLPNSIKKIVDNLDKQISFHYGAFVDLSEYKEIIQIIEKSIEKSESLLIEYYSLSSNQESKRKIDPYELIYNSGAWYLIAYCYNREEILIFRVDRIKDIELTKKIFQKKNNFTIDEYMKNTWGVERSDKEKRVVLIFEGKAARLVKEKEWHPSQEIINLPGDRIRFEVTTGSMEEIKSWILSFGADVEIIRPKELKEKIITEIEKMKKAYN